MKNTNFKTKLVAKITLLVLLLTSVFSFAGCWTYKIVDREFTFESQDEYLKFIQDYNSKNDGSVFTFIDFNFDSNLQIETYQYHLYTARQTGFGLKKMYDKNHSKDYAFLCEIIFYMDEISTQITCEYNTRKYNFYQNDNISYEFLDDYFDFQSYDEKKEELADKRTFNVDAASYDKYYEYMCVYQININGKKEVLVKIASEFELSKKKADEIAQLLVNNIVIINTEG